MDLSLIAADEAKAMQDIRFEVRPRRVSLADLVTLTEARVTTGADLSLLVSKAVPLDEAEPGDLSYLDDPRDLPLLETTHASACFLAARYLPNVPRSCLALVSEEPWHAFVAALAALYPESLRPGSLFDSVGANPGAAIHHDARLERGVVVDPGAVIGPFAEIGSGSTIGANSVIGPHVRIGRECSVGPHVTIVNALIGNRVILQAGARVGHDGFAFVRGQQGHLKVPHIGRVIIQDDVEIGANSAVERGTMGDTVIGEGTKIASQARIGSNARIGRHCEVAAQAEVSEAICLADFEALTGRP